MSHELPPQVPPAMTNGLTTTEQSSSNSLTRDYVSAVADFLETPQDALCACQAFRVALLVRAPFLLLNELLIKHGDSLLFESAFDWVV